MSAADPSAHSTFVYHHTVTWTWRNHSYKKACSKTWSKTWSGLVSFGWSHFIGLVWSGLCGLFIGL